MAVSLLEQKKPIPFIENKIILSSEESMGVGLPSRLKIPSINVDASIEFLGTTPDGLMDSPKTSQGVAWWKIGARPGNIGTAVMSGHYGTWKNGETSVFDNLDKLKQGDKLFIEDERGTLITFVVRDIGNYEADADTQDIFFSNDGGVHLNLITCEGIWNEAKKTYSSRLVIFADKE